MSGRRPKPAEENGCRSSVIPNKMSAQPFFFSPSAADAQDLSCPNKVSLSATLPAANSQGQQIGMTSQVSIPGKYSGTLLVQATAPAGTSFPSNWTLQVTAFQLSQPNAPERERRVARPHQWHRPQPDGSVDMQTVSVVPSGTVMLLAGSGS